MGLRFCCRPSACGGMGRHRLRGASERRPRSHHRSGVPVDLTSRRVRTSMYLRNFVAVLAPPINKDLAELPKLVAHDDERMHDAARQIASNDSRLRRDSPRTGLAWPNFLLTGSERNAQEPVSTRQRQEVQGPEDCWPQPLAPGHSGRGARQARRHLSRRLPGVVRWRDQERRLGRRYPPRTAARGARAIWAVPCRRRRAGRSAGGGHPGDRTLATRRIRGLSQAWAGAIPGCSPRRMEEAS